MLSEPLLRSKRVARFHTISQVLSNRLELVASAGSMRAIREGLIWLTPPLLVSASFLVLAALAQLLGLSTDLVKTLERAHAGLSVLLPFMVTASIAYMLSIQYRVPRLPIVFFCTCYIQLASVWLAPYPNIAGTVVLFLAITAPLICVPVMVWLSRQPWLRIVKSDLVGSNVQEAMNLFVPGLITMAILVLILSGVAQSPLLWHTQLPLELMNPREPYRSGLILTTLNSVLWFFGINGYYALQPLIKIIDQASLAAASDFIFGLPGPSELSSGLLGAFVFIGGAGATLSLALAMLFFCQGRVLRLLALASLPISLLNVNEILLFGLPIILNPRLFIPFLVVPSVNLVLALAVTQIGWVNVATIPVPFNAPVLLNAYVSTSGDWMGVALQLSLVCLGMGIYTPFIRAIDNSCQSKAIYLRSLDTTFTRLPAEAELQTQDYIAQYKNSYAQRERTLEHIREISEYTFFLEYQPQVSRRTGRCTGSEVLIRARNAQGDLQSPGQFLHSLSQGGLMRELDLWVADRAVKQALRWRDQGFSLPMSFNVTGCTLISATHCDRLIQLLKKAQGMVGIEITEEEMLSDVDAVQAALTRIRAVGAHVSIDDFGTAYSSMSYLHLFDVDTIKIDRSFVVASEHSKGERVLHGLLSFCESLQLSVVVEGVETQAQYDALSGFDNLTIQGWYFSPSISAELLPEFVASRAQA